MARQKSLRKKPKQDKASWKKRATARQAKQEAFKLSAADKQKDVEALLAQALLAQAADDTATLKNI